jgi:hypothetical protein
LPPGTLGGFIASVAMLLATGAVWAAQAVTQPALRAAFLYNFVKFTEWTGDVSSGPLTICVVDDTALENALTELVDGSSINGRPVLLSRSVRLRACHLVYLGATDREHAASILEELQGASVLTVSDGYEFVRLGGIVGLVVEQGRMRFAINPDAAQRAGLRLSSRLLQLATILKEQRHGTP